MLRFVPFEPDHLKVLRLQAAQSALDRVIGNTAYAAMLRDGGVAMTAIEEGANGVRVAGCAGILFQWPGRGVAWTLLGEIRRAEWVAVARRMESMLQSAHRTGTRRIEAAADAEFAAGNRLLRMLGFQPEGRMRAYSPEGRDHILYARIAA
jgi:RimJ/RimL family protein N-acetyltransferase